ncbi:MAG: 23S rRNA (uracil(1939)-C(5))-methyltransferase RlmD [Saprospiraceae bacterium]
MAKRKKQVLSNLLITGIADKGKAIGKSEAGHVVFVEGVVPGDVADVLVLRKKKSFYEAIPLEIKQFSPDRITPECQHFGVCGGCKWQNLSYEKQLEHKFIVVRDAMQRIAKLTPTLVQPVLGNATPFYYRNKLEYSFSDKRWITEKEAETETVFDNHNALGFHRPGFFDKIVDIQTCLLQENKSDAIRNFVREFTLKHGYSFYNTRGHNGLMRNMFVRNTTLNQWMIIVVFGQEDSEKIQALMEAINKQFPEINSLSYIVNLKWNDSIYDQEIIHYKGEEYIEETLGNINYHIGPKSFFQTNTLQAIRLFDLAESMANLKPTDNVYDLYTGLGSIALYIADKVKQVVGIEEVAAAIEDAEVNKKLNDIHNATFYAGDVKDVLDPTFVEKHGKPDLIITDPPRAGMHENVVKTLLTLEAPKIVYISCNPATQARDLYLLKEKYDVVNIQPVDMFPHTHHIECVALLELKK